MTRQNAFRRSVGKMLWLTATAITGVIAPLGVSIMDPQRTNAQSQPGLAPTFEVASIKPNNTGPPGQGFAALNRASVTTLPQSGRLLVQNYTLTLLIAWAYDLRPEDISGGRFSRDQDRFDIEAKAAGPVDSSTLRLMLRSLLEERFKLKMHREAKEVPVYALVAGKNGPKAQKVTDHANPLGVRNSTGGGGRGGCGGPGIDFGGLQTQRDAVTRATQVEGRASMPQFAAFLSSILRCRTVLDKTNESGIFDIKLEWSPSPPDEFYSPNGAPDPAMIAALQDSLGLKLETQRGPGEMIVIDYAEKPSEN